MRRLVSYSALKPADWPTAIRQLIDLRTPPPGPFAKTTPVSCWRPRTFNLHVSNLGCFLGWLKAEARLFPDTTLARAASPETVLAYVDDMRTAGLSSKTIAARLTAIRAALGALSPEVDVDWLKNGIKRVHAEPSDRRNTRQRIRHTAELVELGVTLMSQGSLFPLTGPTLQQAAAFRDGLIIVFMALVVPRIGTLPIMNIGEHLARKGLTYRVYWQGVEMKGGRRSHQAELPEEMTGLLDLYLECHHPVLASRSKSPSPATNSALWLNKRGRRMAYRSMHDMIVAQTKAAFGVSVYPHAFRHSAGSTLVLERPDLAKLLTPLLQHSTAQMRETYILADRMDAGRRYGEMLSARRRRGRRRSTSAGMTLNNASQDAI
jgi:integrase/recombinase XerD